MPDAFQHVNRRGDVYYLQAKPDKSGKPKYSFARKLTGTPVAELPEGYEVRELPDNAQVMVRRKRLSAILPDEKQLLERIIRERAAVQMFIVDVEDEALVVYTSDMEPDARLDLLRREFGMDDQAAEKARNFMLAHSRYSKMLRFTLIDAESRRFNLDRWCFRGSIDDWYFLEGDASLVELAEEYVGHLGRESFFDLM